MYTKIVDGKEYVVRMDSETYDEIKIYEEEINEILYARSFYNPNRETKEEVYEESEEHLMELYEKIDKIVQSCDIVK